MSGKFWGIGVGPGDPSLLTIKAVEILKNVSVICLPKSGVKNESVAWKVIGAHVPDTTTIVEISTPMIRDEALLHQEWQEGAKTIAEYLKAGQDVAFVTIGDAMLFSTYTYLMKQVRVILPEVRVESVPGITSYSAAAARLNLPLAEGNENLAIIPAIDDVKKLKDIIHLFPNMVLMKVASQYDEILDVLEELDMKDRGVYVSKLGYPDEHITCDLEDFRNQKREYLSLMLVKQGGVR